MDSGKKQGKEGCERTGIGEECTGGEKEKEERGCERGKMWLEVWGNIDRGRGMNEREGARRAGS